MNVIDDALQWLNDPLTWSRTGGLLDRAQEHLTMSLLAVLLAGLIALPLGVWLGHTGKAALASSTLVTMTRAIPTFSVLLMLAAGGLFGEQAAILAAALFAFPLIAASTHTAVSGVDPHAKDAAVGMGMRGPRALWQVELPLAIPLIAAGLRTAIVQVVATIPLAAFVGGGGLGVPLRFAFSTQRYGQVLAVGVVIAVLCLVIDGFAWLLQRSLTPRALRHAGRP